MPFFCFQVVSIKTKVEPGENPVTLITVIEVPNQNLLGSKNLNLSGMIWAEPNMQSEDNIANK